jgi:hypothetical protein
VGKPEEYPLIIMNCVVATHVPSWSILIFTKKELGEKKK